MTLLFFKAIKPRIKRLGHPFGLLRPYVLMSALMNTFAIGLLPSVVHAESLTDMPLEELLSTEVVTASKLAQQISDSPSAVSIVTAKDIKSYGYRTLADIISSMRGLNTVSDHSYTYMSGRGFGRPGDYAGRIMLLIDGHQANDNLYNSSYLGNDGLLDTELIDRVEYVSGPGAVIYGNGAFYGIINVITKKGSDFQGAQLSLDAASHHSYKERMTFGKTYDNGADLLVSVSHYHSNGQNLYFPEFDTPANNHGVAQNLDQERNQRLFVKAHYQQWSFESAYVSRYKDDPSASFGTDFNAQPSNNRDMNAFANLQYEDDLSETLKTSLKMYYGQYQYRQRAVYTGELLTEHDMGRWWGAESKFVYTGFAKQQIVYGFEYRDDYQQDFYIYNNTIKQDSYMLSAYLQDEYRWSPQWAINLGARVDSGGKNASYVSPRVALIYSPTPQWNFKASYASAFRRPTVNEKYWTDNSTQLANMGLRKEIVNAFELVTEYKPDNTSQWLASLYQYHTDHVIFASLMPNTTDVSQYINDGRYHSVGADVQYEKQWSGDTRLRASYAWQNTRDDDHLTLSNVPRNLVKLNFTQPLNLGFNTEHRIHLGTEVQYVGQRLTEQSTTLGGYTVANVTLYNHDLIPHATVSMSIRNLFDRHYAVPSPAFYVPASFLQDGRNAWLQLTYDFK